MNFAESGLPADPLIEKAFARLNCGDNGLRFENEVKIARNIAGSGGASTAIVCAALMRLDIYNQSFTDRAAPTQAWLDEMHAGFGDEAFMELEHILSVDMAGILNGRVETLANAHPTAKLYAMAHTLFMLGDYFDKGFNGNFSGSVGGVMRKDPPNEYVLRGLNDMAGISAAILNASRGTDEKLESELAATLRIVVRAADAAEDQRTAAYRARRNSRLFPGPQ